MPGMGKVFNKWYQFLHRQCFVIYKLSYLIIKVKDFNYNCIYEETNEEKR